MLTEGASPPAALVRDAATLWRRTLDGVVVLGPSTEDVLHLSGSGPVVWALLAEPATAEQIVADAAELLGQSPDAIRPDVLALCHRLLASGALRELGSPEDGTALSEVGR